MTTITLQAVQAEHAKIGAMIADLQAQASTTVLIAAQSIELRPGERYVGATLDETGAHKHHVILMAARPDDRLDWNAAMAWAKDSGGDLPDRQEQALLYANCKAHLQPTWHWSNQEYESDASYAWLCYFDHGYQTSYHKSAEGCAVAVRRA